MPQPAATPDLIAFDREQQLWEYAADFLSERIGCEVEAPRVGCLCCHCQTALVALTPYLPMHTVH
jgi:hypothetical protein